MLVFPQAPSLPPTPSLECPIDDRQESIHALHYVQVSSTKRSDDCYRHINVMNDDSSSIVQYKMMTNSANQSMTTGEEHITIGSKVIVHLNEKSFKATVTMHRLVNDNYEYLDKFEGRKLKANRWLSHEKVRLNKTVSHNNSSPQEMSSQDKLKNTSTYRKTSVQSDRNQMSSAPLIGASWIGTKVDVKLKSTTLKGTIMECCEMNARIEYLVKFNGKLLKANQWVALDFIKQMKLFEIKVGQSTQIDTSIECSENESPLKIIPESQPIIESEQKVHESHSHKEIDTSVSLKSPESDENESIETSDSEKNSIDQKSIDKDIKLPEIRVDNTRIFLHKYSTNEWDIVSDFLWSHVHTIKSQHIDPTPSKIDWRKELKMKSAEISSNLSQFLVDFHNDMIENQKRERLRIESMHPTFRQMKWNNRKEICHGYSFRDRYIKDYWRDGTNHTWNRIQHAQENQNVVENLDRRIILWCRNHENKKDSQTVLETVSTLLERIKSKRIVKLHGTMAITVMRRMAMWDDFVMNALGSLRIKKTGVYANGDHKMNVNRLGARSNITKRFKMIDMSMYCYQFAKFMHLDRVMNSLLSKVEYTTKEEWQIQWYTACDLGILTDLEISHRGKEKDCVNAMNCDPESRTTNLW